MTVKNFFLVYLGMVVFLFCFYLGLKISNHYKIIHHKKELLENVSRFKYAPQPLSEKNTYYFSTSRDLTYDFGNRDTTLTIYTDNNGKVDWYCGIFWDYRNEYYNKASILDKFNWDDFDVYGYFAAPDTTTREYKLDKQILLAMQKTINGLQRK